MEVSVRNFSVRTDSEYFSTVLKDAGILLSSAPGNLWITGNPEAFVLTGGKPTSAVHVTVTDYWGATVFNKQIQASDNGTLAISISLPPLPPGWYSLGCSTDSNLAAQCCFGVVLRPGSAGNIQAGKVCADAAAAWAIDPSQFAEFAHIVKVIGLPMVRERMHWREVEPQRGEFTWGRYDKLINDYASRGIAVDEIVPDDIPDWAKDDSKTGEHKSPNADDLRNFCLEASQHFRGKITAWEMWNEPDISRSFYDGSPERFLDFTTIAYQALKEGSNSSATVLLGSMCWPHVKPFARDLFVMGAAKYTDAFNWHTYEPYESYSSILGDYRHQCNLGDMPSWMTEAGIFLGTRPNGELSPEDARRQCEYVPKSITRSLASGNSRHFYFILAVSVQ